MGKQYFNNFLRQIKLAILASFLFCIGTNGANAQIALRGFTTKSFTSTSVIISKPNDVVQGDLMIVNIQQSNNKDADPTCTGWTLIDGAVVDAGPELRRQAVLYKVAGASEPTDYTFTLPSGVDRGSIAIVAFSGIDPTSPFDVAPGTVNGPETAGTTATANTITSASANSAIVMLAAMQDGSSTNSFNNWSTTSPGTLTEIYDYNNSGVKEGVGAAWSIKAAAGSTGNGTVTLSASKKWGSILLALKPKAQPKALSIFRSNVLNATGNWNTIASWQQKFDDGNWYSATAYPSAIYGSLTSTSSGYPILEAVSQSQQTSDVKAHLINFPAEASIGDLVVILWADHAASGNVVSVNPAYTGWKRDSVGIFHTHDALVYSKVLGANETAVEIKTTDACMSAQIVYCFKAGTFDESRGTFFARTVSTTNSSPNPPQLLTPSGTAEKVKWIAVGFSHNATLSSIPQTPSVFSGSLQQRAGTQNAIIVAANLDAELSQIDPGVFTIGSSEEWVAATIGVKGKELNTYSTERSIATVRNTHTIAITDNATADTVNVETGGILKFDLPNSGGKTSLNLDISSGSPMTVTGTLEASDLTYIAGAGSFSLASGGTFKVGSIYGLNTGTGTGATVGNVRVTGARSFNALAIYYFNYTGDQNTGSAITAAANVYIEGGGLKTLTSPISISNTLTLTNGYPKTTSTNLLTLSNGASVSGGSDDSYVIGPLRKVGTNSTSNYSFIYPVGRPVVINNNIKTNNTYSPAKIKYPALSSSDITFTVTHYHASPTSITSKMESVLSSMKNRVMEQEYWDVHNDVAGTSGAITNVLGNYGVDVTLYFANPNGTSKTATRYYLVHAKTTADSTYWEVPNISTQLSNKDTTIFSNRMLYVSVLGQKSFSGMGAAGADETTPVTLTNFNARLTPENKVALSWATASESVNKGFRIERQHEFGGSKFQDIGFVSSKADGGNSAQLLYYNFTDIAPKANATSYYRLVQEDIDGKLTNSEVRMIRLNGQSVSLVYPNPSKGNFLISRTVDGKKMNLQVTDQSGKIIRQVNGIESATHKLFINKPGIYNIKLTYPETGEQSIQRVVVH
jgi:hypothetical protein